MNRRQLIILLSGAITVPTFSANAQLANGMRRIGVLSGLAAEDPEGKVRVATFLRELQRLGWTDGRNVRIDIRWGGADAGKLREYAAELVGLAPDVLFATGTTSTAALVQATTDIPIVFSAVIDPVGAGYVESLARPGGNVTGFLLFEYRLSGKWLELLSEIAPGSTRVAVLRDHSQSVGIGQFAVIQAMAPSEKLELTTVNVRDAAEIERAVTAFARSTNSALIVTASALSIVIAILSSRSQPDTGCQRSIGNNYSSLAEA